MSEEFSAGWLALREPFDRVARSRRLAARLAAALPARPRLMDLGAGTASLFRFLAPIIGRAQAWTIVDADAELLGHAFARTADWAEAHGYRITTPGRALLIHTPGGAWRIEALATDFGDDPSRLPFGAHDAVVCSALMDLVSPAWAERLAGSLRMPFLAWLNVDGRDRFRPAHPDDRLVARGFARDMRRDKGLGRAMGTDAPATLTRLFAARGFTVATAPSDWIIPPIAAPMLEAMVRGHAAAAANALPAATARIAAWEQHRLGALARGRLALTIGHRDLLALPAET
ncbi:class I SAM-dependent methyltransferase [Elioraea sp.]|uniref:class I SAM-dependent methyltransferase n=1 Tax=Elioraea sp. TaxID=2185103 RepID=UPI003F6EBB31